MADKSYIGKGKLYLDGRFVGNVSEFVYGTSEEEKALPDYTTTGGGNYNSLKRIQAVTTRIVFHDYNAENLAESLFGSSSAVAAGSVSDESITTGAALDYLVETASMIDTDQTVTVTSDPSGTTYTEDTDYTVSAAGIVVLSTGAMAASTGYLISYTKKAVDVIEALTGSAQDRRLVFDGLNEAQSGAPVKIVVHRNKFGPADEVTAIGDDFGAVTLNGEALKDTTITTGGLSQFIQIQQAA
jgi:hypothetical protein